MNDLKAKKPIKMPLSALFSIYDIHHEFVHSSIDECKRLEQIHNVIIKFYHLDKNKGYWASDLPGTRHLPGGQEINIAVKNNEHYWLPSSNLITERFYCTKMPNKCQFWSNRKPNTDRHEETCSDETIIRARQVIPKS